MKLLRTYRVVVAALVAAVVAVPIAQAGSPTPAELRALEIRGQALNHLCGDSTLTGQAYRTLCGQVGGAANRPTTAELRALEIRGQGLNHMCDKGRIASAEAFEALCGSGRSAGQAASAAQVVGPLGGFDWGDFGIGAAAMLGLVLLAGGIAAGAHYGRRGRVGVRPAA